MKNLLANINVMSHKKNNSPKTEKIINNDGCLKNEQIINDNKELKNIKDTN